MITGGHDHLCGALSSGVFKGGRALISSGTTESLTMALEDIPEGKMGNSSQSKPAFWWGHHVAFPFYYAMNGLYSGGYSIEWILNIINGDYSILL